MSDKTFEKALCCLQTPLNDKALLKTLTVIRKEVEWPKNKDNVIKIREKGLLKYLVNNLNSQQKVILDVTLSILGNCIMDSGCTRDLVSTYNILSPLNHLLKTFSKEDSIKGRIFRIIGNILRHRDQRRSIIFDKKPQLVIHIVTYIKKVSKNEIPQNEKVSEATIIMAIKALRLLLNRHTMVTLVDSFEVLKAVGSLFVKYSLEWQEHKTSENILNNIIILLEDYSRYRYYRCITEMRNTDLGDSLIHLAKVLVLAPKRIVKIVMNYLKISQLKSELPVPEICDKLIDVLKKYPLVRALDERCIEYLECLCSLLEHPANINLERFGKIIPPLIQLLQNLKEPSDRALKCCILVITTLNKCRNDNSLVLKQLEFNVIQVLIMKLQNLVDNSKSLNLDHMHVKKRKNDMNCLSNFSSYKKFKSCWNVSPSSPSSAPQTIFDDNYCPCNCTYEDDVRYEFSPSPCSSSGSEQLSYAHEVSDCDSDNYSPICSEADASEFPPFCTEVEEVLSGIEYSPEFEDKQSLVRSNSTQNINYTLEIRLLQEITKLIRTFVRLRPFVPQLASEELLIALVKCSGHFNYKFSSNMYTLELVHKILDSHESLIPLMQTEFIETIYPLTDMPHNSCAVCLKHRFLGFEILEKFTVLAESGVGEGDIAYTLTRGDDAIKQKLVLVIPYIIRRKPILCKLMLNCGGLAILMRLLRDNTNLRKRSIKVICALAKRKLHIANPKNSLPFLSSSKLVADSYKLEEGCSNVVTFQLDDGALLRADRNFLSKKSDFFDKLFNGNFKESGQDVILLHNVNEKPLRCLLHLLTRLSHFKTFDIDLDLDTILEVILLSDRYLMFDLCVSLTNYVEQCKLSLETVPIIYQWSLESGTNLLRIETIAFTLVENIKEDERVVLFEDLFKLGYAEHLADDIHKLLMRYMTSWSGHKEMDVWTLL